MKRRFFTVLLLLVLLLAVALPASAEETTQTLGSVTDAAGLLTEGELLRLEALAEDTAQRYAVGVYVVTIDDYREFDPTGVFETTYGIYHRYSMGVGRDRNGIMLLLSMRERDYGLFCYGEKTEYAFNSYGQEQLETVFLDNLGENDWYGGFEDYITECAVYLEKAENGQPVRESPVAWILLFGVIAIVIALVVCGVLVGQMKSVARKTTAGVYAVDGLRLTQQTDRFTHRTESRRKIETSSSSGSVSHSGGGGSGRSGKF